MPTANRGASKKKKGASKQVHKSFSEHLQDLKDYKKDHKHVYVLPEKNVNLYEWLKRVKRTLKKEGEKEACST